MLPFVIACAACLVAAKFFVSLRPKKTSAFIFFPVLAIISAVSVVLYYMAMSQGAEGTKSLGNPFQTSISAAFIAAFYMWSQGKGHESSEKRRTALAAERAEYVRLEQIERSRESKDSLDPDEFPAATLAIRHRPEVNREWERIEKFGPTWSLAFLAALERDPKLDPVKAAESIGATLREVYPFSNESVEMAYLSLSALGASVSKEFRTAVFTLGETVDPKTVAATLLASKPSVESSREHGPGLYGSGSMRLRITPDRTVVVFCGPDGRSMPEYQTFADLDTFREAFPAQVSDNGLEKL